MEDNCFDQVENQAALIAEGILKLVEPPEQNSSTALTQENNLLKEIEVALDSLVKLVSKDDINSGKAIAEGLSNMEDFLRLMLRLMQEMMTSKM